MINFDFIDIIKIFEELVEAINKMLDELINIIIPDNNIVSMRFRIHKRQYLLSNMKTTKGYYRIKFNRKINM